MTHALPVLVMINHFLQFLMTAFNEGCCWRNCGRASDFVHILTRDSLFLLLFSLTNELRKLALPCCNKWPSGRSIESRNCKMQLDLPSSNKILDLGQSRVKKKPLIDLKLNNFTDHWQQPAWQVKLSSRLEYYSLLKLNSIKDYFW